MQAYAVVVGDDRVLVAVLGLLGAEHRFRVLEDVPSGQVWVELARREEGDGEEEIHDDGSLPVDVGTIDFGAPLAGRDLVDAATAAPVPPATTLDLHDPLSAHVATRVQATGRAGGAVAVGAGLPDPSVEPGFGAHRSTISGTCAARRRVSVGTPSGGSIDVWPLDVGGAEWGGLDPTGRRHRGSLSRILRTALGGPDGAWVAAAVAALERDIAEVGEHAYRSGLVVRRGAPGDVAFHVSRAVNRTSILAHGLDWRRMGAARGIANSPVPERRAVFLDRSGPDSFFTTFTGEPLDVWAVDLEDLWTESDPAASGGRDDTWAMCPTPIPADRLRLVVAG